MRNLFEEVRTDFAKFNIHDKVLLATVAALFLPFQYAALVLAAAVLYFALTGQLKPALDQQTGRIPLYLFVFLEIAVSLFYGNWVGLANAAGYLLGALYIALYRRFLSPRLFQYILELMILMSWLAAAYGLYEFKIVSNRQGYDFFDFVIQNKPKDRINSTFKNANFYATMCDFFILFCLYEYIHTKRKGNRIYYVLTALLNFFMLLLTGCRTAILPFFIIFPLFFGLARKKKLFYTSLVLETAAILLVLVNPEILPRINDLSTLDSRIKIWKGSFEMIKTHPLFGMGPQTYGFQYALYGFHRAPHSHNILIDALTSFGITGTCLGLWYGKDILQETFAALGKNKYSSQFALIISFLVTALILGLLDCTLNFVVTGVTFMIVLNSCALFKTKGKNTKKAAGSALS